MFFNVLMISTWIQINFPSNEKETAVFYPTEENVVSTISLLNEEQIEDSENDVILISRISPFSNYYFTSINNPNYTKHKYFYRTIFALKNDLPPPTLFLI